MLKAMSGCRAPTAVAPAVGCGLAGPKSGRCVGVRHDVRETLEAGSSDVREHLAVRPRGGLAVQVDRQLEPLGHSRGEGSRTVHASLQGGVAERHEGHDVDGTDAWMAALVTAHVDPLERHLHGCLRGQRDPTRVAGKREHAAVVVGVRGAIEEPGAGMPLECRAQRRERA